MKVVLLACVVAASLSPLALAADNPWVGTWKLDPAKSRFTGETFTYSKAPNGMMHFTDGSTTSYDFAIDGQDYPAVEGRTTSWVAVSANVWYTTTRYQGKVVSTSTALLSTDGKTLSAAVTRPRPDGTTSKEEDVWTRVSGTTGLVGKWKSTKVNMSAPEVYTVSTQGGGVMRWEIPAYQETITGKMDGSDLAIGGPTVAPGMTIASKLISPKKLTYVVKDHGKPVEFGRQTLAADGKSFVEVSWGAGKESEKTSGYYVKQ